MGRRTVTPGRRAVMLRYATCVLLAVLALAACRRTPDEQQVRQAIDAAVTAARANDAAGVLDATSEDFVGNDGAMDRRALRRLLALRALRQDKTGVLVGPINFEHKGDRIIASFNLVLTGGRPGDLLPTGTAIYSMHTAWRRDGRQWRCYSATWSRDR